MGSEGRSLNGVTGGVGEDKMSAVAATAPVEVPTSSATVDISLPRPEMTSRIISLCKELVKGWSSLDSSCFSIGTVSGGITNLCEFLSLPVTWHVELSCVLIHPLHLSNTIY